MKTALERLLCLAGRHRWSSWKTVVADRDPGENSYVLVTEVCDRPWCRGRTTRRRWY